MKQTISSLYQEKQGSEPISWLTCDDYSFATGLNNPVLDMILVRDSGGIVAFDYPENLPVSMNEMTLMAAAVRRGAPEKFIDVDIPEGSNEASDYKD